MTTGLNSIWKILGIEPTRDFAAIRRAYAVRLKAIDARASPDEFIALRGAFEQAGNYSRQPTETNDEPRPFPVQNMGTEEEQLDSQAGRQPRRNISDLPDEGANEATAKARIEEIAEELTGTTPGDVELCRELIERQCLVNDSFSARKRFILLLAQRLCERRFGLHSGAMLLAAQDIFGWRDPRELANLESAAPGVYLLLSELGLLSKDEVAFYLLLCDSPSMEHASRLWQLDSEFGRRTPMLTQLFFGEDHLKQWRAFLAQRNVRLAMLPRRWRSLLFGIGLTTWRLFGWRIAAVASLGLVCIIGFNLIAHRTSTSQMGACETYYATAAAHHWKNLPADRVAAMMACARMGNVPKDCEQREALAAVLGIAETLSPMSFDLDQSAVVFALDDGRSIAFAAQTSCDSKWHTLTSRNWFAFDDVSAKAMLADMKGCQGPKYETLLTRLLPHLEGWAGRQPGEGAIPLDAVMGQVWVQSPLFSSTERLVTSCSVNR